MTDKMTVADNNFLLWIYRRRLYVASSILIVCFAIAMIAVFVPKQTMEKANSVISVLTRTQKNTIKPAPMLTINDYNEDVRNIDLNDTAAMRSYKWDQIRAKFIGEKITWQVRVYDVKGYKYPTVEFVDANDDDPSWDDGECNLEPNQSNKAIQLKKGELITIEGVIKKAVGLEIEPCKFSKVAQP